jgi:hypothetical protein
MDELDDAVVPFWVEREEAEPPSAVARLYLDRAYDPERVEAVRRRWWSLAEERLTPLFGPEPPEPWAADDRRGGRTDPSGAATLSDVAYDLDILDHDAYAVLRLFARLGADHGPLDQVADVVLSVLRDAAVDPLYGELTVNGVAEANRTALDVALDRGDERSLDSGRAALRGYEWVTVCPAELVPRLDLAGGAFAEVAELAGGGVLLRATPTVSGWTPDAARAVFTALAPVLPDGMPQRHHGADLSRIVFADAAEVRAGRIGGLPVGPPLPESGPDLVADLTAFISEAMRRGWLTMEPMDESAIPAIRALFPAEAGVGLTPEGQRRLAERLGLA